MAALKNKRRDQRNLLAVLSATRYRMITKEGPCDTCCPLQACRERERLRPTLAQMLWTNRARGRGRGLCVLPSQYGPQNADPGPKRPPTIPILRETLKDTRRAEKEERGKGKRRRKRRKERTKEKEGEKDGGRDGLEDASPSVTPGPHPYVLATGWIVF